MRPWATLGLALTGVIQSYGVAGPPSLEYLGDLPGGTSNTEAVAVSADGSTVVGQANIAPNTGEAFRWHNGVMTSLGDLPGDAFLSGAQGVSADGSVVVGWGVSASGGEAFRWENGVMSGLGDLPGGAFGSSAYATSADGSVVVGASTSGGPTFREPFRWVGGVMSGLGGLPGGTGEGEAFAVSADGAVVVGWSSVANGTEGFRWENGVMTGLGDLPGGALVSWPLDVSADGSVVVGGSDSEDTIMFQAFRWENGLLSGLGHLPGGAFDSVAVGVSADGSVVVGAALSQDQKWHAFIWTGETGMLKLGDVVTALGLDLGGWMLSNPMGISDDGLTIVGNGWSTSGSEGWIATLPPDWVEQVTYELDVSIAKSDWAGWGTVDVDPNLARYFVGRTVTLTALPDDGIAFKKWRLYDPNHPNDPNYIVTDANNPLALVMTADRQVVAVFRCAPGGGMLPMLSVMLATLGLFVLLRRKA